MPTVIVREDKPSGNAFLVHGAFNDTWLDRENSEVRILCRNVFKYTGSCHLRSRIARELGNYHRMRRCTIHANQSGILRRKRHEMFGDKYA